MGESQDPVREETHPVPQPTADNDVPVNMTGQTRALYEAGFTPDAEGNLHPPRQETSNESHDVQPWERAA